MSCVERRARRQARALTPHAVYPTCCSRAPLFSGILFGFFATWQSCKPQGWTVESFALPVSFWTYTVYRPGTKEQLCGGRKRPSVQQFRALSEKEGGETSGQTCLTWVDVQELPAQDPLPDATILPVFPLGGIYWPGSKDVQLNIIDPAYRKMYDDLLMSGARQFVVPFTKSLPGGRVRYAEMPVEDRRLHAVGSVLHLEDLKEVSGQTADVVKYVVSHSVRGVAMLKRLLNPSALFETDAGGNKINYLRAEVQILDEPIEVAGNTEASGAQWREISECWQELQALYKELDEPHLRSGFVQEWIPNATTWEMATVWQQLQTSGYGHRARIQALARAREWIQKQQELGRLPAELADMPVDPAGLGLPKELLAPLFGRADLPWHVWEQLLAVLATEGGPPRRAALLLQMAREELRLARARRSLRGVFGS